MRRLRKYDVEYCATSSSFPKLANQVGIVSIGGSQCYRFSNYFEDIRSLDNENHEKWSYLNTKEV